MWCNCYMLLTDCFGRATVDCPKLDTNEGSGAEDVPGNDRDGQFYRLYFGSRDPFDGVGARLHSATAISRIVSHIGFLK